MIGEGVKHIVKHIVSIRVILDWLLRRSGGVRSAVLLCILPFAELG